MSIKQKIIAGVLLATNMFPLVGAMENNNGGQQNVPVPPSVAAQAVQPGVVSAPPAAQTMQPGVVSVPPAAQAAPRRSVLVPQKIFLPRVDPVSGVSFTQTFNATGEFNFMRIPLPYGCNPFLINAVYRAYSCNELKNSLRSMVPNLTPPQSSLLYLLDVMDGVLPFENTRYMQSLACLSNFIGDDKPINSVQGFFYSILGFGNQWADLIHYDIHNFSGDNPISARGCNISKDTVIVDINPKESLHSPRCVLSDMLQLKPENGFIYDLTCFSCLDMDSKSICTVIKQEDGNWYEYGDRGVKVLCEREAMLLALKSFSLVYHKR